MIGNDREERFLEKTKGLLNGAAENLDSRTRQRLEHIRIRALRSAGEKRSGFSTPLRWVMVGGFAAVTMAAVALFFWLNAPPGDFPARHIEDFEIITSREPIDFYQELEFYRWMATPRGPADRAV